MSSDRNGEYVSLALSDGVSKARNVSLMFLVGLIISQAAIAILKDAASIVVLRKRSFDRFAGIVLPVSSCSTCIWYDLPVPNLDQLLLEPLPSYDGRSDWYSYVRSF